MSPRNCTALCLSLAIAFALGGCARNPVRDLAVAAGYTGGEPKTPPDFVSRTRQQNLDYIPVGTSAPKRVYRVKTADEVNRDQSELAKAGARNPVAAED